MLQIFRKTAKISVILVYLIIVAGAVVRMTGSGMGCPDWPKCFGYYIPPTEESQLQWKADSFYKEGRIIIVNEELRIAPNDFTSGTNYEEKNWDSYTTHDYATFNPIHTWIEYINRLVSVLAGIPILLMAICSIWLFRKNKWFTILSWLVIVAMGFQAWLGKTVVDSNLAPFKITIHMVMALVIVAMILHLIFIIENKKIALRYDTLFNRLLIISTILTLTQIILGTQVRQFVDEQVKIVGYNATDQWLTNPRLDFYIHRSFSFLVFGLNAFLFLRNRKLNMGLSKMNWVLFFIFIEIISGIAMYYIDFPFGSQPIHIVIATLLFGVQFYLILESRKAATSIQTS